MKLLLIGPLPPPVTGHALACKILLDELIKEHEVDVINLSKTKLKNGLDSLPRVKEVIRIICEAWRRNRRAEAIYLTISESLAGNIKDLLIYLACFKRLSRMVVHLHGGTLRQSIFDRSRLLVGINRYFICRLGGVIVLGPTHVSIFEGLIDRSRLHIVPNFAEDYLFTSEGDILRTFKERLPVRILFLSNLIQGKGFDTIVDAYSDLSEELKQSVRIDFAGAFESETHRLRFLGRIERIPQMHYHGIVDGPQKRALLSRAHIFCLPTCLAEGQPIAILEAYASGCVVLTTNRGGIRDVFLDKINGFEIEPNSSRSVKMAFENCIRMGDMLIRIALANFNTAREKYRTSRFVSSVKKIMEAVSQN